MEVVLKIQKKYESFNSSQRKIADYIINHIDICGFITLRQLAKASKTTEVTVINFARKLGFTGFADMKSAIQLDVAQQISPNAKIEESISHVRELTKLDQEVIDSEISALNTTYSALNREQLLKTTALIHQAKRVYLIAYDYAATLSSAFEERFVRIGIDVINLGGMDISNVLYRLALSTPDDLLVLFSYKPYTQSSIDLVKYLRAEYSAKVICFSDNETAPMAHHADSIFLSPTAHLIFTNSMTAPFSLITLLASLYISKYKDDYRIFNKKLTGLQKSVEKTREE
jgi:RpiR family murPQ operon transcriptional repressor